MSRTSKKFGLIQFVDFDVMLMDDYIDYVEDYFEVKEKEIQKGREEKKEDSYRRFCR